MNTAVKPHASGPPPQEDGSALPPSPALATAYAEGIRTAQPDTPQDRLLQAPSTKDFLQPSAQPHVPVAQPQAEAAPLALQNPPRDSIAYWYAALTAPWIKHFIAGGIAGGVSRTVVSPLERMKIIFQVQGAGTETAYRGVVGTLIKMWKEEGFRGYMRGNGTNVVRIVPYSAVQFASYEQYKKMLMPEGENELTTPRRLASGALAGITSVGATYPLDIIRTRLSVQSAAMMRPSGAADGVPIRQMGIWETSIHMYRYEGGLRALFRGLGPTMTGVAPYVALNFQAYEVLRKYFTPPGESAPGSLAKLGCGALAGTIAQTCTYPLDVLRRRMQVTGMAGVDYKYDSTWHAARQIIAQDGIRGLYRGMIPNYLKVAPAIGVSFLTYEWCKTIMIA